jgi:hypothetical protein
VDERGERGEGRTQGSIVESSEACIKRTTIFRVIPPLALLMLGLDIALEVAHNSEDETVERPRFFPSTLISRPMVRWRILYSLMWDVFAKFERIRCEEERESEAILMPSHK